MRQKMMKRGEVTFEYFYKGKKVNDSIILSRIADLRIPPGYHNVRINPDKRARIQWMAQDDRGRSQYRYSEEARRDAIEEKHQALIAAERGLAHLKKSQPEKIQKMQEDLENTRREASESMKRLEEQTQMKDQKHEAFKETFRSRFEKSGESDPMSWAKQLGDELGAQGAAAEKAKKMKVWRKMTSRGISLQFPKDSL